MMLLAATSPVTPTSTIAATSPETSAMTTVAFAFPAHQAQALTAETPVLCSSACCSSGPPTVTSSLSCLGLVHGQREALDRAWAARHVQDACRAARGLVTALQYAARIALGLKPAPGFSLDQAAFAVALKPMLRTHLAHPAVLHTLEHLARERCARALEAHRQLRLMAAAAGSTEQDAVMDELERAELDPLPTLLTLDEAGHALMIAARSGDERTLWMLVDRTDPVHVLLAPRPLTNQMFDAVTAASKKGYDRTASALLSAMTHMCCGR